jgi:hypothetical protein
MYTLWLLALEATGDARKDAQDGCCKQRPPDRRMVVLEINSRIGNSH